MSEIRPSAWELWALQASCYTLLFLLPQKHRTRHTEALGLAAAPADKKQLEIGPSRCVLSEIHRVALVFLQHYQQTADILPSLTSESCRGRCPWYQSWNPPFLRKKTHTICCRLLVEQNGLSVIIHNGQILSNNNIYQLLHLTSPLKHLSLLFTMP